MGAISYSDTSNTIYDPADPRYWEQASLDKELHRAFDLCNGCRMCFKYCPSFPSLFELSDKYDNDVTALTEPERDRVINECYQCKICYVKCPYTDRDKHAYNLDFPSLMQRAVHVRVKAKGLPLRDKVLSDADLAGRINSGLISGLVNKMMGSNFHRRILEAVLGVHRQKSMPLFHKTSFARWFERFRGRAQPVAGRQKVVLFSTCFVNYNNPRLGMDTVEVLEKSGLDVLYPKQNCCGMPGLNSGDLDFAVKKMKANVECLYPFAKDGAKLVAVNPTCSLTLKTEMVKFLPEEYKEKGRVVAEATMDLLEFLFELKKEGRLNRDFKSSPGEVAYHVPCHLRAQNIGYRSRDVMRLIPGASVQVIDECCGHNGTWAMKKEYFDMSLKAGERAFAPFREAPDAVAATDCPLAAIQLEQGASLKERPDHPVQILAKAYKSPGQGGFSKPAEEAKTTEGGTL